MWRRCLATLRWILGVCWDPGKDQLVYRLDSIADLASSIEPTKRNVVSTVGRFYDPLGFMAPVVIKFKVFFQTLCDSKVSWDEPLPETMIQQWQDLVRGLRGQPISLSRTYFAGSCPDLMSCYLCGFCDASSKAYAAVVYLVVESKENVTVSFVSSKTRVAPMQSQTIPRLELLSALLLSRLLTTVTEILQPVLPIGSPKCFTDSQVALYWIQGIEKEWKPFVQNRVNEIRKLIPVVHWKHCPGTINPADIPSRGFTQQELSASRLWLYGPEWLRTGVEEEESNTPSMPDQCQKELKAKMTHNLLTAEHPSGIGEVMNSEDYGSMCRLLRVTAYVLRAVEAFKSKKATPTSPTPLTAQEMAEAEKLWIAHVQTSFNTDRNFEMWKRQFGLSRDEAGLWRCGGRLTNADIPPTTKHPLFLPRKHHLTSLIVREAHERVRHNGVKETLTELRARYWIVKGRSLVRSIIHHCVVCKRFEGPAYQAPQPPPLPVFRVKEEPAFSFTGVDFAGPFYIRSTESAGSKVWLCLFTCCVTRAVHLDIVSDLHTTTFIRCLKRFAARRGLPHRFISDNGKTFQAAAKAITTLLGHKDVQEYLSNRNVEWTFNLEKSPW